MYLKFEHKITGDVFRTKITVDSYGTEKMPEDIERELLSRYPIIISTKDLEFMSWIRRSEGTPIIADISDFGAEVLLAVPNVEPTEWLLGDTFEAVYEISLRDIPAIDLNTIVVSREFAAQAYCMIYDNTIKKAVSSAMRELRAKHRPFEETEIEEV